MKQSLPPKLRSFPKAKQQLLDQLLDKNSNGELNPSELARLQKLVADAENLMVENAKRLSEFSQRESKGMPTGATPVTVWVSPVASGH